MEGVSTTITLDEDTIKSPNLCDKFTPEDRVAIGNYVFDCFQSDWDSCEHWRRRTEAAMDLAMQIQKDKNFPWPGCSNVAFPLVTIAALQFHARAYPAIVNGRDIVQCRTVGDDPQGTLASRAERISSHMSWQLLEEDEPWEEQQDRALINVPIVGTAFKKSYYDPGKGHNVSELVLAKDLVLSYWAKSVDECPVKTHIIPLFRNQIYERCRRDIFIDILQEGWYKADAQVEVTVGSQESDNRAGLEPPESSQNTPFIFLEQHCVLDLDGDGYAEPYIATIEQTSKTLVRLVTRFDRIEDIEYNDRKEIVRINAMEYFTKIPFIPSPDGGIMDVGFGVLIGPLNESVDTAINQLFDAGTMANTAGGFLARGAKIRGGVYQFSPFEWNRVDSAGDDLKKSILPLPVREPSSVLFNLLSLLIDYTNRISGATDMLTGINPGQNTPAETARSMVEQGQKVYSAIFKRIWRSLKQEFKKLYQLNAIYLPIRSPFGGAGNYITREDYTALPGMVVPVADPNISSDSARFAQANLVKQAAMNNPAYDTDAVERYYLKSLGVDGVDILYKGMDNVPPPQPDVKLQIEQMRAQTAAARLEYDKLSFVMELQETQRLNTAKILEMSAKVQELLAKAKGVGVQQRISAFNVAIAALKEDNNNIESRVEKLLKESESGKATKSGRGNVPRLEKPSNDSKST